MPHPQQSDPRTTDPSQATYGEPWPVKGLPWWAAGRSALAAGIIGVSQLLLLVVFIMELTPTSPWWAWAILVLPVAVLVSCVATIVLYTRRR